MNKNRLVIAGREKHRLQIENHVRHADVFAGYFIHRPVLGALEHLAEGFHQIEQRGADAGVVIFGDERLHLRIGPDVFLDQALLLQHLGGVLELFVLEQPVDQLLARIFVGRLRASSGSRGSSILDLI